MDITNSESDSNYYDDNYIISTSPKQFNPYNIIAFDTESYRYKRENGEIQKFYNIDFYDGINHYYSESLNDVNKLIKEIQQKYHKITLFAHNIPYDLRISHLLKQLIEDWYLGLYQSAKLLDKVIFIKFADNHRHNIIQFMDSMNYFRTSLSELSSLISKEKLNEENYNLPPDEWNNVLKKEGKDRVQKDTEILYQVLKNFFNAGYCYGITLASTSFNTFRKYYLKKDIAFPKKFESIAESSYKGGIVMPYILARKKKLKGYDINSLYPFVMSKYPYSVKFHRELDNTKWIYDDIKNMAYNYLVNVDYLGEGYSPIYSKFDNKLIPFLSSNEWITGNELLSLYENNFNIKINKCYEFKNEFIFKDFIDEFYNKRKKSVIPYEKYYIKILMNSLYGKFGQHKAHSKIMNFKELPDDVRYILRHTNEQRVMINEKFYSIYDNFVSITEESERRFNILIASEITGNARIVNYNYSKYIGFNNLFYTDTDSFFTDKNLVELVGNELGQLKIEKEGIFNIFAPKDYAYYGICNDKECDICHSKEAQWHIIVKGVDGIVDNNDEYLIERWSKIKYKTNDDVYVERKKQKLKRENTKMNYNRDGIGYEWKNKKEYCNVLGKDYDKLINDNKIIENMIIRDTLK